MLISFSPLLQRRPQTSYHGYRKPSICARTKSACTRSEVVVMPRTNVSVARFYDWSDDLGDCVSVSKMYRDVANVQRGYNEKIKGRGRSWCSDGIHINPGRMFVRDKATLTRGEKEIIQGIYRNRGDVPKEGQWTHYNPEWYKIKSHKDAWLIGKHFPRSLLKGELSESLENLYTVDSNLNSPRIAVPHLQNMEKGLRYDKTDHEGPVAPPCTPDSMNHKRFKIPPINRGRGSVLAEGEQDKSDGDARKTKMYVDIFLPKIPFELQEQNTFVSLGDRERTILEPFMSAREKREHLKGKQKQLAKDKSSHSLLTTSNTSHQKHKDQSSRTSSPLRE